MADTDALVCMACQEREAEQDSFLCEQCCPEPEAEPADVWQPALPMGWAA